MASWKDLRRYLQNDGWELYKQGRDDWYRKELPNGEILISRVSKGTGEISPGMFSRILKQQLRTDKATFNSKI